MTAPTSATKSRETSGGVAMATGSLARVSAECGPGSVTGCSAVNNDLVVCAAQECCNVWEYSTQSRGWGWRGGGEREDRPNLQKPDQFLSSVRSRKVSFSHFLLSNRKLLLAKGFGF